MLEVVIPKSKGKTRKKRSSYSRILFTGVDFNSWLASFDQFSNKNKKIFFDDLSVLLSSGINLVNALDLVSDSFKREKDKALIKYFIKELTNGVSFYEVLKNTNKFSPYEYYSIKIGEETGKLSKILIELSKYVSERIEQKRKVMSAFSYPVVILLTAIIAVAFMLNFIVPMFEEIFKRFDKELPYLTKLVIQISENISFYSLVIVLVVILLMTVNFALKNNTKYLLYTSSMLLKIPIFGILIKKVMLARFCLTMELLLSAKTPLVESISLSRNMVGIYVFRAALLKIEMDIMEGVSLHNSMRQFRIFDIRMIALIKVAEEVNKLEEIFKQLKLQLNNDIEYQTSIISSIMEPMLIVFIGLFVGMILVSMYLPIFQISTSFM